MKTAFLPFLISEFCITGTDIPIEIADKILKYHIKPIVPIREELNAPMWPSDNSAYRPVFWEESRNRSGKSQHCFIGKGAVDWTTNPDKLLELLELLKKHSPYLRICYYPNDGFIHCDYKDVTGRGDRRFYTAESQTSKWKFIKTL